MNIIDILVNIYLVNPFELGVSTLGYSEGIGW